MEGEDGFIRVSTKGSASKKTVLGDSTRNLRERVSACCSGAKNPDSMLNRDVFKTFMTTFVATLNDVFGGKTYSVVSYGLGRFLQCQTAAYQLAVLLQIPRDRIKRIVAYDPLWGDEEREYLRNRNIEVMSENTKGLLQADGPTLFYMPHCGRPLLNNALYANQGNLKECAFVCNSMKTVCENMLQKHAKELGFLQRAVEVCEERAMPPFPVDDVFNDVTLHVFQSCLQMDTDAPTYSDCFAGEML